MDPRETVMSSFRGKSNDKKSNVFEKALSFVRDGKQKIDELHKEIDRERTQSLIDSKNKERELKNKLIDLIKDKRKFARDSKQEKTSSPKQFGIPQEIIERRKKSIPRECMFIRDRDCFPEITCTAMNVPKILRRSISIESETYNWLSGLPNLSDKPSCLISNQRKELKTKSKAQIFKPLKEEKYFERNKSSKVEDIVYNIPIYVKPKDAPMVTSKSMNNSDVALKHYSRFGSKLPPIHETRLKNTTN